MFSYNILKNYSLPTCTLTKLSLFLLYFFSFRSLSCALFLSLCIFFSLLFPFPRYIFTNIIPREKNSGVRFLSLCPHNNLSRISIVSYRNSVSFFTCIANHFHFLIPHPPQPPPPLSLPLSFSISVTFFFSFSTSVSFSLPPTLSL